MVQVPGVGFGPTNPFGSRILSPLRKPFRHPGPLVIIIRHDIRSRKRKKTLNASVLPGSSIVFWMIITT